MSDNDVIGQPVEYCGKCHKSFIGYHTVCSTSDVKLYRGHTLQDLVNDVYACTSNVGRELARDLIAAHARIAKLEAIEAAARTWAATPGDDEELNRNALALYWLVKP